MRNPLHELEQLKQILQQAPCGIGLYDAETGEAVFLNRLYYSMMGLTPEAYEKAQASNMSSRMFPADLSVKQMSADAFQKTGQAQGYEYRVVRGDGSVAWVKMSASSFTVGGKLYAFVSFTDMTGEKELATHLSLIAENVGRSLSLLRISGKDEELICGNSTFFQNVGFEKDAYRKNMPIIDRKAVSQQDSERIMQTVQKTLTTGEPGEITHKYIRSDGKTLWLHRRFAAIRQDTSDTYLLVSVVTDITRQREAELDAALKQRRFQTVIDELDAAVFEWDLKTNQFYTSEAYGKYAFSRVKQEEILSNRGPLDTVHPEDVPLLKNFFQETDEQKPRVEAVLRLKLCSGAYRWCRMIGFFYRDGDGVPSRTVGVIIDIHDERERRFELEKIQKKEQALLASIPGGIAIYRLKRSGVVTTDYVSEGLAKMCGYGYEAFLSYLRDNAMVNVKDEDIPLVMEAAQKSIETGKPVNVRYHIHTRDGADILIRLDANLIEDSELGEDDLAVWYAVHTAVAEDARLAIKEQEHYRMILNLTGAVYFEWDRAGGFYSSEKFAQYAISGVAYNVFMWNAEKPDGIHPDDYLSLQNYTRNLKPSVFGEAITVRLKLWDGSYRWTEITCYAERDSAGFTRLTGILRDIDKEHENQNARLQAALEKAQKADRAKSEFLSQMSHEIRTPMNGIIGMTKLAQESATDEKTRGYLREIDESSQYMMGLLNDVLDMGRIESGKMVLNRAWVNINATLWPCIQMMEPMMRAKGISFVYPEMKRNKHVEFYVDPLRIKQIVMNLLNNAYKFTPSGGTVELTVRNVSRDEKRAVDRLTIRDTGCGMSEAFLKNGIYKPFSQEQNAYSGTLRGTGLGLALVKEIVEKMDGAIEVSSELGTGTAFSVTFTYDYRVSEEKAPQEPQAEETPDQLRGVSVLLVDDHPLNRKIAKTLLENAGMLVEQAENGRRGVEAFARSNPGFFDLILMDIRMPVMDGLEAAKAIRALSRPDAKAVPIIAMTANAYDEDIEKSLAAGMNAHLAKPVAPSVLYASICRQLRRRGQSGGIRL